MTLNPDCGIRWCIGVGLIGVGSSRESDVRGLVKMGNSVVLTDGLAAIVSGVGVLTVWGAREISSSRLRLALSRDAGLSSTWGSTSAGAVVERLGGVRPVIAGGIFSLSVLTVDSGTTEDAGLGRVKP